MRLDRLATLLVFHPLARGFAGGGARTSVLMYHSVSDAPEDGVHPYYRVNTTPQQFAEQMRYLHESDCDVVPLREVARAASAGERSKRTRVAITFDDGYRDFLTAAFPMMQKHHFPSSVFLPTAFIGDTPQIFKGKECLTWSEVRELRSAGVDFGSHTVSHPQLHAIGAAEVEREVRESKTVIEQKVGASIDSFSYPYAFPEQDAAFRQRLRGLLERCGYAHGVSTILGTVQPREDHFFLKRLPVNLLDDARLLRAKLEGGYNWLHGVQYAAKLLKAKVS